MASTVLLFKSVEGLKALLVNSSEEFGAIRRDNIVRVPKIKAHLEWFDCGHF